MSAAPAYPDWSPVPAQPPRGDRRHLRMVRPGERAAAPAPAALRLTRRGRLAVTLSVAALVLTMTALMTGLLPAGASAPDHVHVVLPGQTLSEVAAATLPDLPLDRAVVQVQLANDLSSLQVQAGQELVIPGR